MGSEPQDGAAERGPGTRWVELAVAAVICAGAVLVMVDSARIGASWASDGPQAGYFPFLTGVALLGAGLWIIVTTLVRWRKLAGDTFVSWERLVPVTQMLLPTIAYVVVVGLVGIYVASAIFIGAFMIWKGRYRLLAALSVAIGVPVVMFLLFEIWFLVPLPKGPLERMLGW
jgi:hypothetical protein